MEDPKPYEVFRGRDFVLQCCPGHVAEMANKRCAALFAAVDALIGVRPSMREEAMIDLTNEWRKLKP